MFLKFEHYDLAINEVSHYGFFRGHSPISVGERILNFFALDFKLVLKPEV
jgi:hypothetical protein